jgi:hypothetical protein
MGDLALLLFIKKYRSARLNFGFQKGSDIFINIRQIGVLCLFHV